MTPHTFGGETVINRRTLLTTPGIQARIASDLVKNSAIALEKAMFGATDLANAPKSLLTQISDLKTGTADWDYKNFLATIAAMTDAGVPENMIRFAMKGATLAELKGILKDKNSLGIYLVGDDNLLCGRPIASSGVFDGAHMLVGDFSGITIGEWAGLSLDVDPYTEARNGGVCLRVFADLDWAVTGQAGSLVNLKKGTVTK